MSVSLPKFKQLPISRIILLLLLVVLVCIGTVPGYLAGGKWRWMSPPKVATLSELKAIKNTGLPLNGWQTVDKQLLPIGNHKWLKQDLTDGAETKAILLLFPQNGPVDQPQVEWTDIQGTLSWKTDSDRIVEFTASDARVTARYFRGWTKQQTYAVVQWYAWSTGGHPDPSQWFLVDRLAQLQNRRAAWVTISLLLPIEPLGDIEKSWDKAQSLAQTVQSSLMSTVLRSDKA
jgi:cyanoexosortase B-associated protein